MTMRFGFMPSFNMDLLDEIKFAKKHFDFIEITLKLDLPLYDERFLKKIKNALDKFELLGHLHWEIDLIKPQDIKKALKNIEIYDFLGCKKITIHPSQNLKALREIIDFCRSKNIQLLIENTASSPFNQPENLKNLFDKVPVSGLTLDIGHARNNWSAYLDLFFDKIKHIHLHYSDGKNDHLQFPDENSLKKILVQLSRIKKDLTISLEIFKTLENRKLLYLDGQERRKILLEQLAIMKKADPKGSAA